MVSIKQLEANRQNAQKSSGPKTPQGKTKSSQNAVTHGLTSQRPVLTIEDKNEFDAYANEILVWLDPQDPIETLLARRVAILSWRLQRASVYETLVLDNLLNSKTDEDDPDTHLGQVLAADFQNQQTLAKVQNYETKIERSMLRCLNTLKRIRDSKLLTYSKITDYVRGGDDMPEPYFQDKNADAKFPDHLEKRMSYRKPKPKKQNEPKNCHSERSEESDKLSMPQAFDQTTNSELTTTNFCQNEPISEIENPPASQTDNDFEFYPRWANTILNEVGYSEKARKKMTKVEREEAADRVLCDLEDPKQYLLDRDLIFYPKKQNEPILKNALSIRNGEGPNVSEQGGIVSPSPQAIP
jgi:hypothetical protein